MRTNSIAGPKKAGEFCVIPLILSNMNSDNFPNPTLRDLACEIGQVQIYWCFLENEMRRQLNAAGMQERIARGTIVSHWRTYMTEVANKSDQGPIADYLNAVEKVAKTRNLLAHGIRSVAANPWESDSAVVVCAAPDGLEQKLTIQMIRGLSEEIDSVRLLLRRIIIPG